MKLTARALAFSIVLVGSVAFGHNFWVTPSAFRAEPGEAVDLTLFVGHGGEAEAYGRKAEHLKRFWVVGPDGSAPDVGAVPAGEAGEQDEERAAGRVVLESPGVHVVGYRSHPSEIELGAEKFEGYLREEGLEDVIADRARRGETGMAGREAYSRSCKTLVLVGGGEGERVVGFDRRIGLAVEITPLTDPFRLRAGDELRVSVEENGRPAVGVRVDAEQWSETGEMVTAEARTDERGEAVLVVSRSGEWLITTTLMERAEPGRGVDWESVWGSLTVEVGGGER